MAEHPLQTSYLGLLAYEDAWQMQKALRQRRIAKEIDDQILLVEHPPTITLGRLRGEASLRLTPPQLEAKGITVVRSDRGGDATLHAPGQLVGYLIVDLTARRLALPTFVECLAQVFISWLDKHQIKAHYDPDYPGVWVQQDKIVAFGFHIQQGVTMHGFAFNLHTDLELFDLIVPCGLHHKGVTSLAAQSNGTIPTNLESIAREIADDIQDALLAFSF